MQNQQFPFFLLVCFLNILLKAPEEEVLQKKHASALREQDLESSLAAASLGVRSVPPGFFRVGDELVPELNDAPSDSSSSGSGEDQSDLKTAAGLKALAKQQDCLHTAML